MTKYRIYAGLNGGFGGAVYECTESHKTLELAEASAYYYACQAYEMQEGSGLDSWDDFYSEAEGELSEEDFEDFEEYNESVEANAIQAQNDDMESWIEYYVEEVKDDLPSN